MYYLYVGYLYMWISKLPISFVNYLFLCIVYLQNKYIYTRIYSIWIWSWSACFRRPCLSREIGPGDLQMSLLTSACNAVSKENLCFPLSSRAMP